MEAFQKSLHVVMGTIQNEEEDSRGISSCV